ncbi:MAG: glycosyltransferase family 2 protein [bacterium]
MADTLRRIPTLSVIMIARNEASRIRESLRSAAFADEIVVVDTGSMDNTREIAREEGAVVVELPFSGFGRTKQSAINKATCDWVFVLDADERISAGLRDQILSAIRNAGSFSGYRVHRRGWFLGRPMKHGGWGHDEVVRLFLRGRGRMTPDSVDERIVVDGQLGTLEGLIEHQTDPSFPHYLAKLDKFTTLAAEGLASRPYRAVGVLPGLVHGTSALIKQLLMQQGFRDGSRGVLLALSKAYAAFLRYTKAGMIRRGEGDVFIRHELSEVDRHDHQ